MVIQGGVELKAAELGSTYLKRKRVYSVLEDHSPGGIAQGLCSFLSIVGGIMSYLVFAGGRKDGRLEEAQKKTACVYVVWCGQYCNSVLCIQVQLLGYGRFFCCCPHVFHCYCLISLSSSLDACYGVYVMIPGACVPFSVLCSALFAGVVASCQKW